MCSSSPTKTSTMEEEDDVKERKKEEMTAVALPPQRESISEPKEASERPSSAAAAAVQAVLPGTIGLSGVMTPSIRRLLSAWLVLRENPETGQILALPHPIQVEDFVLEEENNSDTSSLPMIPQLAHHLEEELNLMHAELVSINGMACCGCPLDHVQERFFLLEGVFTLIFKIVEGNEWIKQVTILNPAVLFGEEETMGVDIITCTRQPEEKKEDEKEEKEDAEKATTTDTDVTQDSNSDTTSTQATELCIGPMNSSSPSSSSCEKQQQQEKKDTWLHYSPMEEGDRILAVNDQEEVTHLDAAEAEQLIHTRYTCSPYLSLVVQTPPSKQRTIQGSKKNWRQSLRKGVATVGGGTMVGAGML
jgi:hypothetical protein